MNLKASALEFIIDYLNCASDKEPNATPVNRGHEYALTFGGTPYGKIKLINFEPKHISCNHEAKTNCRE